jgi:hypothetical protein
VRASFEIVGRGWSRRCARGGIRLDARGAEPPIGVAARDLAHGEGRMRGMRASRLVAACAVGAVALLASGPGVARDQSGAAVGRTSAFRTSRTFLLGPGRDVRTFAFRERAGVILLNRLIVPRGTRVIVEARIPGLAGAGVQSWPRRDDPTLACTRDGSRELCTQGEEWCPMPRAVWRFRLVKLAGPAAAVRFDYVVAAPPSVGAARHSA